MPCIYWETEPVPRAKVGWTGWLDPNEAYALGVTLRDWALEKGVMGVNMPLPPTDEGTP